MGGDEESRSSLVFNGFGDISEVSPQYQDDIGCVASLVFREQYTCHTLEII